METIFHLSFPRYVLLGDKGLIAKVKEHLPKTNHVLCYKHLEANVLKQGRKYVSYFKKLAFCSSHVQWDALLGSAPAKLKDYLCKIPLAQWSKLHHKSSTYGRMASQVAQLYCNTLNDGDTNVFYVYV